MSNTAINELDHLITKLESELGADPRFTLLNNLKAARAAYPANKSDAAGAEDSNVIATRMPVEEGGPTLAPARAKAFKLCRDFLRDQGEPVRTRQLYQLVEDAGVDLPGGMNNLSALLGRHPKVFRSHGRLGWTLKDQSNSTNAEAAGDLLSRSAPTASISSPPDQRTNLQ